MNSRKTDRLTSINSRRLLSLPSVVDNCDPTTKNSNKFEAEKYLRYRYDECL